LEAAKTNFANKKNEFLWLQKRISEASKTKFGGRQNEFLATKK